MQPSSSSPIATSAQKEKIVKTPTPDRGVLSSSGLTALEVNDMNEASSPLQTPVSRASTSRKFSDLCSVLSSVSSGSGDDDGGDNGRQTEADDKYGYETAEPSPKGLIPSRQHTKSRKSRHKTYAIDGGGNEDGSNTSYSTRSLVSSQQLRHGSMSSFHYRPPRRSSMKGSTPGRSRHLRRASMSANDNTFEVRLPLEVTVQRRSSITFDDDVSVEHVESVHNLVDGETESIWFQDEEYERMKRKSLGIAKIVDKKGGLEYWKNDWEKGKNGETKGKPCIRGLEGFLREKLRLRAVARSDAWDSVLDEQHIQRHVGQFDDEALAESYRSSTAGSQIEAAKRAREDEIEVQKYTKGARERMMRRLSLRSLPY